MAERPWLIAAALLAGSLAVNAEPAADGDGFKHPLDRLHFNQSLDQREFERSSLAILNVRDPWERWNRRVYHFNYRFDEWLLLPVVRGYRYVTPGFVRSGVRNFFSNLAEIPSLLNSLLQGRGKRALDTGARLLFNTTLGVAGLWDPASRMGLPRQSEDFGQTLGAYGVSEGPYLMLPILGPSNLRDAGGQLTDFLTANWVDYLNVATASDAHPEIYALKGTDLRDSIPFRYGQLNSPFEYNQIRYVYTRARRLQIEE
ncbi:phospholipid-binding lipoprotein MlaA [Azotobacter beijerinckii]|uniref:Phospholipid-binding lipoprotein MlaA n=1 Tax=Azotobacter beijerinckii TaxID=170623 RepID=A0A1H6RGS7_9GAMM|nr:phospholipid-binding lipoprotein MlaA [Azotobacter beijerinckii]SEI91914.1 phospholipid-binding lipoprotein MlaA [Azotobacter beijerinckii]